jgi:hypothetical protein
VNEDIGIYVVVFVWVMAQRPWKDLYLSEFHKRMWVTGGGDGDPDELKCAIDMFGVHFQFAMTHLVGKDFQIECIWSDGDIKSGIVHGEGKSTADIVTDIIQKIRSYVSREHKTNWTLWQQWLVNWLCDGGVVPGTTGQVADAKGLKLVLSRDGSNYYVMLHYDDSHAVPVDLCSVSYTFVPCADSSRVLIRRAWNGSPSCFEGLADTIIEDLERASAIERYEQAPIDTGSGSEITGGRAAAGDSAAVAKLRFYEAVVDLLIRYRGGRMSEESAKTVSEVLENLDTVSH